jgi:hypothetical protein
LVGCVAVPIHWLRSPGSKNAVTHHLAVNSRKRIAITESCGMAGIIRSWDSQNLGRTNCPPRSVRYPNRLN